MVSISKIILVILVFCDEMYLIILLPRPLSNDPVRPDIEGGGGGTDQISR